MWSFGCPKRRSLSAPSLLWTALDWSQHSPSCFEKCACLCWDYRGKCACLCMDYWKTFSHCVSLTVSRQWLLVFSHLGCPRHSHHLSQKPHPIAFKFFPCSFTFSVLQQNCIYIPFQQPLHSKKVACCTRYLSSSQMPPLPGLICTRSQSRISHPMLRLPTYSWSCRLC